MTAPFRIERKRLDQLTGQKTERLIVKLLKWRKSLTDRWLCKISMFAYSSQIHNIEIFALIIDMVCLLYRRLLWHLGLMSFFPSQMKHSPFSSSSHASVVLPPLSCVLLSFLTLLLLFAILARQQSEVKRRKIIDDVNSLAEVLVIVVVSAVLYL